MVRSENWTSSAGEIGNGKPATVRAALVRRVVDQAICGAMRKSVGKNVGRTQVAALRLVEDAQTYRQMSPPWHLKLALQESSGRSLEAWLTEDRPDGPLVALTEEQACDLAARLSGTTLRIPGLN